MKFIDEAKIEVEGGRGGKGCCSFRREKYVPRGGPDGGDGGDGGSIIFQTQPGLYTLMDVRFQKRFAAKKGGNGLGKNMTGANGEDKIVGLPVGTIIYDDEKGLMLTDLNSYPMQWIAAKGGRGGRGNTRFASSTNQAPMRCEPGESGEKRHLRLELKLLADVGIIGFPNAGKSTLISSISNARPKIANYPFTTKVPNLGMVKIGKTRSFVVADMPGLIENASHGAGMGIEFLRHIERTKALVHLLDPIDPSHPNPVDNYIALRRELGEYDKSLLSRPELVVVTKQDLPEGKEVFEIVKKDLKKVAKGKVIAISAISRLNLDLLLNNIWKLLT